MKTAILITARLKSDRLPKKVIKPIKGKPMINHMIDRLKTARRPEQIILCTSPLPQDDLLALIAEQESIECFRGHPDDVLKRLTDAAERYQVDTVINCTADNPLVDAEYIDRLVDFHQENGYDYSRPDGLPLGTFGWALSRSAMKRACKIKAETDTEVWGGYFTDTGLFKWDYMPVDQEVRWPDLRLTVDTPEDFDLISRIFEELYVPGKVFSLFSIVNLCRNREDLIAINSFIEQKPAIPIKLKKDVKRQDAKEKSYYEAIPKFQLGDRFIGEGFPPFVIAEVGINHEGDIKKAIQLVDAAVQAGADCVKFQSHITEAEMIPTDMRPGDISQERLWDIIKRCEFTETEEREIKRYCEKKGILYLCTPFSREAADRLEAMEVVGFKIGSGECNNLPLVKHIADKGKPVILSTGMNNLSSIRNTVAVLRQADCPFMLMHCTSAYPTPYESVRLGCIQQLREVFGVPVGLSDHSLGIYTCLGAIALGACAVEKHFTISRDWPGPDNPISIEPRELTELVKGARAIHLASGGEKVILPIERSVIDFAYASVVAIDNIRAGEIFSLDNLWVKRPGDGPIHAENLERILGKKARRNIPANAQICEDDIEGVIKEEKVLVAQ